MRKISELGQGLTRSEQKLLAVLTDPKYFGANNAGKAEAAGISDRLLYQIVKRPHFKAAMKDFLTNYLTTQNGPILDAAVQTAKEKGRDGFNDRKMLLEMSGMYEPPKVRAELEVKKYDGLSDAELDAEIAARQKRLEAKEDKPDAL